MTGKCVISKKMEPARFWLLWLINIHDLSKVTSLFPSSSNFSPSWFFIFKRSFIHLVLSGNRLVASLVQVRHKHLLPPSLDIYHSILVYKYTYYLVKLDLDKNQQKYRLIFWLIFCDIYDCLATISQQYIINYHFTSHFCLCSERALCAMYYLYAVY